MSTSEFVGEMVALVNRLDPSRPVDSASGGRDLCNNPPIQWQSCGKYGNFTDVHHCEFCCLSRPVDVCGRRFFL